jgi:hypothetical protein
MGQLSANQRKNLVVAVATLVAIGLSTLASLDPGYYYFPSETARLQWSHPTGHFLVLCAIYVAEALFIAMALTRKEGTRLWPRALLAGSLFLPWTALSSMAVVHAPVYAHVHTVWTWLLLLVLILATLASAGMHAIDWFYDKRPIV